MVLTELCLYMHVLTVSFLDGKRCKYAKNNDFNQQTEFEASFTGQKTQQQCYRFY